MKVFLIIFLTFLSSSYANIHSPPIEMSLEEYQNWKSQFESSKAFHKGNYSPDSQTAMDMGERLHKWINQINANRDESNRLVLVKKGAARGIPIERPNSYGPSTISATLSKLIEELPLSIKSVVTSNTKIPHEVPDSISDDDFVLWGRKISSLYQIAVRFETMIKPWLNYYSQRRWQDIRGYYFLKNRVELERELSSFSTLDTNTQELLKEYLLGLCLNSQKSREKCNQEFITTLSKNELLKFKNNYWEVAKTVYDSFFMIQTPRTDTVWQNESLMIPFQRPTDEKIGTWLKENVEDEFKWENFELTIDFDHSSKTSAFLKFQSGVTPHVSGGNIIVMDANEDISDPASQWTIRHEFGHILRIPDCYLEFYDVKSELVISYQIDTTDLMCSRAGNMNERIYKEIARVYKK